MGDWTWALFDSSGARLRSTEGFEGRAEAEAWLAEAWADLRVEGAEEVALYEGDTECYRMGLGGA